MTFELLNPTPAKLQHVNVRAEMKGKDVTPAVDLKITFDGSNDILTTFDPWLRSPQYLRGTHEAIVPMIPVHLRPQTALDNYHILWEAEWSESPPVDPMLLRQLGGDLWIVVAAWDLTPVERAVMASRVAG